MAISQNCLFSGSLEDAEQHAPGEKLAARLCEELRANGWGATEPELWRDSGWMITASREGNELEATLASVNGEQSLLQIAPRCSPGAIGRWFKKTPSASADSVLALSRVASAFLVQAGFVDQRWCWDGFPADNAASTPQS